VLSQEIWGYFETKEIVGNERSLFEGSSFDNRF
jgi:hypothetical protein